MNEENGRTFGRRTVLKAAGAAGLLLAGAPAWSAASSSRKRYAVVGVGSRARMFTRAITDKFSDNNEIVGICDRNAGRASLAVKTITATGKSAPLAFAASDFDRMIKETKPQYVIVTTTDASHDDYIVRALDAGCDVITEKPMTTTAEKAQRILDAVKRSGRHIRVTFNYRYSPPRSQIKDLLMSGEIGDVISVDFTWLLNTVHGADYFRRWHANKANSGGLMVHKATHHFDLVNWWLGAQPESVHAFGSRQFYTPETARRMGLSGPHERCLTCPEKQKCSFYFDLAADPGLKAIYLDNEKFDGYYRDRCVWRPDIDIEDTMNVMVRYDNGAHLNYALSAYDAWEGYHIAFNGTKGRLEHRIVESGGAAGAAKVQSGNENVSIRIIPIRGQARDIEPWTGKGSHGGGDDVMLTEIFGEAPPDKYKRVSDERAGAWSALVGIAANKCFATGQTVRIADLVTGLAPPDRAPMPDRSTPVPMPIRIKIP
ncbi:MULTISPECIES: Gfo/Idh/MocA family protein [unclassified Massilia]|uniref:Gfo/Idh/MocA family protein n=1 Tax=unclassified Massilia TaxID=2609279 RepID=UPI001783D992|nr:MULTISPECIES: Gfo/Idh/MocA family oxidoreductase [unclassified Massilia]MBD8528550.1 Gfo/Idh/MocA family oxidoreductase [Massilia sp. CFBP 13647]MBD8671827.1 Gfo/Idh/MocA family oxidoreductase [Massilia sp. CFBP 13721]